MGRKRSAFKSSPLSPSINDVLISELHEKHRLELENLSLITQPINTVRLFILATAQCLKQSLVYVLRKGGWFMLLSAVVLAFGIYLVATDELYQKHVQEVLRFSRFVVWWVTLGIASSIGLGSGLHTFVLYLGPHIALFTIKAVKCGRVDLKSAPYDTILLKRQPSWLAKNCSEYGPPLFQSLPNSLTTVPLTSILPQVQLEAILWGCGTALGELPPYFISRAAQISGSKMDAVEELGVSLKEGVKPGWFQRTKLWLFYHSQHLNFFTILILASVPNPLFDLAGIMCGQFGIPFWKFFLATLVGKAVIKTHIQTVFIISVCNNQLLEWIENETLWILGLIPGFPAMLPEIIDKLHNMKEKYLDPLPKPSSHIKTKKFDLSLASIWNTIVWLMLMNFIIKIVNSTAQRHLKQLQQVELADRMSLLAPSKDVVCHKT